jgi:arginine-tRNA-protein transferase
MQRRFERDRQHRLVTPDPMNLYFSTDLAPCPYLDNRLERRLVVSLENELSDEASDRLVLAGFRRSQNYAYRPTCPGCSACVPIRIPVDAFVMTRSWRRTLRHNADLRASERPSRATEEQFTLFERYLHSRHADGGMANMGWNEYRAMVDDSPKNSQVVEWRYDDDRLAAVSLTDRFNSGLSGVYKFFDPDAARRSLGTLIILWHVQRALELGLPYVYLGYWIAGSPKMDYKARFRPLEHFTRLGWQPMPKPAAEDAPKDRAACGGNGTLGSS